jgi:hypothetical protein
VEDGTLALTRGDGDADADADATIAADPAALAAVLWHNRPLEAAEADGGITITGRRSAAKRFLGLFPLPAPATA